MSEIVSKKKSSQIFLKKKRKNKLYKFNLKPTQVLVLGFLMVICVGTFLLSLPFASKPDMNGACQSVGFVNALFTSTSAVCVTGLVVVSTIDQWTLFGKVVILLLIQVGRLLNQESLNQSTFSGMVRLVRYVFLGTMIIEVVGAILLTLVFLKDYSLAKSIYLGVFHSISAFCNAGFDVIGNTSLVPYVHNWSVNLIIMALIILGGVGYTVWIDLLKAAKMKISKQLTLLSTFRRLSLHTKIVLSITGFLILSGAVIFFALEMNNENTIGNYSFMEKVLASLFQSVSPRTAGFNTIFLDKMEHGTTFVMIILMFIGGSPAGTAGGIKTVTAGVIFFFIISVIRSKDETEVFNRRVPTDLVRRSLAIMMISLSLVVGVTILLTITEKQDFLSILFETVSAFGTVGLTLGITNELTVFGKLIIALTMFIGRLGPMTLAVALATNIKKSRTSIRMPEERIMVG